MDFKWVLKVGFVEKYGLKGFPDQYMYYSSKFLTTKVLLLHYNCV